MLFGHYLIYASADYRNLAVAASGHARGDADLRVSRETPAQSDRLPVSAFMHDEVYRDYTPADIDRHYTPKEELSENRHFVEINGKETLAQIFTDIRYTRKDNESMSQGLLAALKQQGFMD